MTFYSCITRECQSDEIKTQAYQLAYVLRKDYETLRKDHKVHPSFSVTNKYHQKPIELTQAINNILMYIPINIRNTYVKYLNHNNHFIELILILLSTISFDFSIILDYLFGNYYQVICQICPTCPNRFIMNIRCDKMLCPNDNCTQIKFLKKCIDVCTTYQNSCEYYDNHKCCDKCYWDHMLQRYSLAKEYVKQCMAEIKRGEREQRATHKGNYKYVKKERNNTLKRQNYVPKNNRHRFRGNKSARKK